MKKAMSYALHIIPMSKEAKISRCDGQSMTLDDVEFIMNAFRDYGKLQLARERIGQLELDAASIEEIITQV